MYLIALQHILLCIVLHLSSVFSIVQIVVRPSLPWGNTISVLVLTKRHSITLKEHPKGIVGGVKPSTSWE